MNNEIRTQQPASPVAAFSKVLERMKPQMALALPKHMSADRMARLALTAFSTTNTCIFAGLVAAMAWLGPTLDAAEPPAEDVQRQIDIERQLRFERAAKEICGPHAAFRITQQPGEIVCVRKVKEA